MALRIGIDGNCWSNRRGYGRYTRELLRAIFALAPQHEYRMFLDAQTESQSPDLPAGPGIQRVVVRTSQAATRAAAAGGHRSAGDLWAMTRAVHRHGADLDLFYFPSVYTYFPIRTRARVIVTIHDTIAERHPALIFPDRRSRWLWGFKVWLALRRADLIVAVSDTARRDVIRRFRIDEACVRVVADAAGPAFHPMEDRSRSGEVLARYGVRAGGRFLLSVGGISPHKNLGTLVEAYAGSAGRGVARGIDLVIVGDYQQDVFFSAYASLRRQVDRLDLADRVIFTGFVPDEDLPHFYNAAEALIIPSRDEGFGLPAVEAMACGTPVIASRAGALPEVVGDAGLLFDPDSFEELRAQIESLLGDERLHAELRRLGLIQAERFSWPRSARAALALFEEVAAPHGRALP